LSALEGIRREEGGRGWRRREERGSRLGVMDCWHWRELGGWKEEAGGGRRREEGRGREKEGRSEG
jgi:hypothetical protein